MGKLSLKKNHPEKNEKQTTLSSFFKSPSSSEAGTTKSLFSTVGSRSSSSAKVPTDAKTSASKPKLSTSRETTRNTPKSLRGIEDKKTVGVIDLTDDKFGNHHSEISGQNSVKASVCTAKSTQGPNTIGGKNVNPSPRSKDVNCASTSSVIPSVGDKLVDNGGSRAPGSFFFSSSREESVGKDVSSAPGSFFFSASSPCSNEKMMAQGTHSKDPATAPNDELTVVPESQILSPKVQKVAPVGKKVAIFKKVMSAKLDLDDSLISIPPTPESKPSGFAARKRIQGRSFMLSASNLTSGHPGSFKPRKQLKPKGKAAQTEPSHFEGCNYSLTESNKEVEKYSDLQMNVLFSAHGMIASPISAAQDSKAGKLDDCDGTVDDKMVQNTQASDFDGNNSDAKLKKVHVVSSKVQKHSDRSGKQVPPSGDGANACGISNALKGGLKRRCMKGTGISPDPKKLTPQQHYGEMLKTRRDLISEMEWSPVERSTPKMTKFGSRQVADAARSDYMETDDVKNMSGRDVELGGHVKMDNLHKKSVRKHRLQMSTASTGTCKIPDKKSLSYNRIIASRNRMKDNDLVSSLNSSDISNDEVLCSIINEMKSPVAVASAPKVGTECRKDVNCDISLSGGFEVEDEEMEGIDGARSSSHSQDNEDDILSDIIGEIRSCTQGTQAHGYDKKLNRKWRKLDAKNHSFSSADVGHKEESSESSTSANEMKKDLNANVPVESMSSPSEDPSSKDQELRAESVVMVRSASSEMGVFDVPSCDESDHLQDPVTKFSEDNNKLPESSFSPKRPTCPILDERKLGKSAESVPTVESVPAFGVPDVDYGDCSMDGSWMEQINLDIPHVPEEDLSKSFSKFSPFKKAPEDYDPKDCPPPCTKFGRHSVLDVLPSGQEVHLLLKSIPDDKRRKCILTGFWADTHVKPGDIVNVLARFDASGVSHVNDQHGLLVVNPDYLVSGTTIVSSVYCMRRSVLNAKFKGMDGRNVHMLYGSIIHSLFQKVIHDRQFTEEALLKAANDILQEKKFLHEIYALGLKEATVLDEIKVYIPQIISWGEKHVPQGQYTFGEKRQPKGDLTVISVKDIEENVWSPRFGVKGKIDVTVDVKLHKTPGVSRKIVPLELKTGKSSFSVEHKGQVTLYSMMTSDRRPDPEMGILLYLKDGAMQNIPAKEQNKKGLLQLRNELTHYLFNSLEKVVGADGEDVRLTSLPRPISNDRACKKCPHLLTCAMYQRSIEELSLPGHPMESLVPETLSHLSQCHLDYFVSWCYMLQLEDKASKSHDHTRDIWCENAVKREKDGGCLSCMILAQDSQTDRLLEDGNTVHSFVRHHAYPRKTLGVSFAQGESVVISCENKSLIALSIGYVVNCTEECIELSMDRNLRKDPEYSSMIFRLDKCNLYNSMATNFSNLAKLMEDDPASARLRELLIDRRIPEFSHTLSKGAVEKVRHIFKKLNKPQKTAVLKVLMSQDFVLIKGFPGTGKTSTIIALVRILVTFGYSVLLTSYTHSAVDNILLKLIENNVDFLRLGRLEKIHSSVHPYSAEVLTRDIHSVAELEKFYASKQIVATTCFGVTHQLFTQRFFDVCIVDEASQVLQPACIGPLFYAKKFALVGDPLQLPPVVQSRDAIARGMDRSLIVRLDTNGATYELDVQYRMNRSIMELSNQLVYNGVLKCGSQQVAQSCLRIPTDEFINQLPSACDWIKTSLDPSPGREVLFLDTTQVPALESRNSEGQVQNEAEAIMTLQLSFSLIKSGVAPADIGIIAPYRNQVKFIKKMIESSPCVLDTIEVNTVDQYQGRDKDVIIISYVRSQPAKENTGDILHDLRRLNVAITRAKHKLIFIGHVPTLRSYRPLKDLLDILRDDQIYPLPTSAHSHLVLEGIQGLSN